MSGDPAAPGGPAPSDGLSREDAYIEVMLLMALADGQLQGQEATQLALTVAHREEFRHLTEDQLGEAITRALERLAGAESEARLAELSRVLPTEAERFKATVFAYSILVADGVVAPGETRCLLAIQEAFGLTIADRPGGRPARQRRAEVTRARLVEAGRRLLASEGYHATSSKKIAREAGVAIGSFYNYFDDKKALFLAIFRDQADRMRDRALAGTAPLRAADRPDAFSLGLVTLVMAVQGEGDELLRERVVLRASDPDVRALFQGETAFLAGLLHEAVGPLRPRLRVDDAQGLEVVVTLVEETLARYRLEGPLAPTDPRITALADVVARYLFDGP